MRYSPVLLLLLVLTVPAAAQRPFVNFFLLPDSNGVPGSESELIGPVGGVSRNFDLTASQVDGENGYVTLAARVATPSYFDVVDLHFRGVEAGTGAQITIDADRSSVSSRFTTSHPSGTFPLGASVTCSLDVILTTAGLSPFPGRMIMSGVIVPGFYHRVVLLTGWITSLPGVTVSLYLKQDAFVPNITWTLTADGATSAATRSGSATPESLLGHVVLVRDPIDHRHYTFESVDFSLSQAPLLTVTAPPFLGGDVTLLPESRTVSGMLSWMVDGAVVTHVLPGSDTFRGPALHPERVTLTMPTFGSLSTVTLDLHRFQLTPSGSTATLGSDYQPLLRAPPGFYVGAAASFSADPGLNTPTGDVPVVPDILLDTSITPGNGIFLVMQGVASANGEFRLDVRLPPFPLLAGGQFFLGAALFNPVTLNMTAATQPHRIIL